MTWASHFWQIGTAIYYYIAIIQVVGTKSNIASSYIDHFGDICSRSTSLKVSAIILESHA
ncbi:hypothetical protein CKO36_00465 [Rhabdochromatium marinum]|nr:hypothetical protein [Rhabdochromatium marinum]